MVWAFIPYLLASMRKAVLSDMDSYKQHMHIRLSASSL